MAIKNGHILNGTNGHNGNGHHNRLAGAVPPSQRRASTSGTSFLKVGLVAPGLFNPGPSMFRFREAAKKEAARLHLRDHRAVPGFDAWFLDWVRPGARNGRPRSDETARVYAYCYEQYILQGKTRLQVCRGVKQHFGVDLDDRDVLRNARRHGGRQNLPMTRKPAK